MKLRKFSSLSLDLLSSIGSLHPLTFVDKSATIDPCHNLRVGDFVKLLTSPCCGQLEQEYEIIGLDEDGKISFLPELAEPKSPTQKIYLIKPANLKGFTLTALIEPAPPEYKPKSIGSYSGKKGNSFILVSSLRPEFQEGIEYLKLGDKLHRVTSTPLLKQSPGCEKKCFQYLVGIEPPLTEDVEMGLAETSPGETPEPFAPITWEKKLSRTENQMLLPASLLDPIYGKPARISWILSWGNRWRQLLKCSPISWVDCC